MPSGECTGTTDRPAGGDTGRLFLTFGGPVCADRISYCPLDRVLTYKNLIYLLNLQFCGYYFISLFYAKFLPCKNVVGKVLCGQRSCGQESLWAKVHTQVYLFLCFNILVHR